MDIDDGGEFLGTNPSGAAVRPGRRIEMCVCVGSQKRQLVEALKKVRGGCLMDYSAKEKGGSEVCEALDRINRFCCATKVVWLCGNIEFITDTHE
jgi:hypothetical protein